MEQPPRKLKNKWLEPNASQFRKAKKTENRLAGRLGGRRLPRSGGMAWSATDTTTAKGDLSTREFLIESKRTEKASISLKKAWLFKVKEGASRVGRDPALLISFEANKTTEDWICIPLEVFERLKECSTQDSSTKTTEPSSEPTQKEK